MLINHAKSPPIRTTKNLINASDWLTGIPVDTKKLNTKNIEEGPGIFKTPNIKIATPPIKPTVNIIRIG